MRFPVDADLVVFFYTVGRILLSLPRLRRSSTRIPVRYQIENVPANSLTERQARYFAAYDEKLAAINYWPVCTYRVDNCNANLVRQYGNPAETSRCIVLIHEQAANINGRLSVSNTCLMSFHTRFTDDRILTTRNRKLSILDRPPYHVVQQYPQLDDPARLKRHHDARAQSMGCPVAPPADAASIFKDVQSEHERFSAYQIDSGSLRLLPDGKNYVTSDKALWRGIRKHLNPLEHNFSISRFLPVALLVAALPAFAVLVFAPAAAETARNIGFPPVVAAEAVVLACYLVAGAIIGYVLERQTFVWVFLLTYVSVRLFARASLGPVPYSAFAGSVAYTVAQAKKRRRAVLLPHSAG
jgi:hypothetical protein